MRRLRFTNDADVESVIALQERVATAVLDSSLVKLQFDTMDWGEEDVPALAAALQRCTSLKTLHLEYNRFGDGGVAALASAFSAGVGAGITNLSFGSNDVGDAGVLALMGAIVGGALPQLASLTVGENPRLGNDGFDAIASAASSMTRLRTLKAANCGADAAARRRLRQAFGDRPCEVLLE